MCGIGAVFSNNKIENISKILEDINTSLHHRGPDGNGLFSNESSTIGLSHTRLSIIDLSSSSSQPFHSSDDRYVITFNGEIYNYLELKKVCIEKGSEFKSSGDTEVVVELFRHFGESISTMLRGMWAFVIYDTKSGQVYISRDPFGIKPLFYGLVGNTLIFSSEIKVFQSLDSHFLEKDEITVELFSKHRIYDRGDWTFFKNIKKFPHSSHFTFNEKSIPNKVKAVLYFDPSKIVKNESSSVSESTKVLKETFLNSIKLHMRSDVPVGFCLSGGIDSSSIVCAARLLSPDSVLKTFTTRFPAYKRIDESNWAELVINHVKADPFFIEPKAENFKSDLKHLMHVQDEPFGSASIYSQFCIFRGIAKEGVKVVLDGQGADEIFGGYHSFFPYYITSLIREKKFLQAYLIARKLKKNYNYDYSFMQRVKTVIYDKLRLVKRMLTGKKSPSFESKPYELYHASTANDSIETRLLYLNQPIESFEDFLKYMVFEGNVPMLLRFEDRNSMAFSIESRVPFLINELVEYSLSIPASFKMKAGVTKAILRDSMSGIVPANVLSRMDKLGFPAPDKEWMKEIYGDSVDTSFSDQWISLILKTWNEMILTRRQKSRNFFS